MVRGAWRRVNATPPMAVSDDERAAHHRALLAYSDGSEALFTEIDQLTLELTAEREFAIWGAGQFTMKWMRRSAFPRGRLALVIDSAASRVGLRLLDHDVLHPDVVASDEWPTVILAGSAYAAAAIGEAARARGVTAAVDSPFPST